MSKQLTFGSIEEATYRIPSNDIRTLKICYPREGSVLPILLWYIKLLGCGYYQREYGILKKCMQHLKTIKASMIDFVFKIREDLVIYSIQRYALFCLNFSRSLQRWTGRDALNFTGSRGKIMIEKGKKKLQDKRG